jgi:hypothetical protein
MTRWHERGVVRAHLDQGLRRWHAWQWGSGSLGDISVPGDYDGDGN